MSTFTQFGAQTGMIGENSDCKNMSAANLEQKALSLLKTFENAGKSVSRVIVEGRRIELELSKAEDRDEYERIDMRHGKT